MTDHPNRSAGSDERKTFNIPPGYEAVRDGDGRATGEVRKIPTDAQAAVVPDCAHPECDDPEWCAGEPKCRYASQPSPAATPTIDDVPSCGQENDYRRASPAATVETAAIVMRHGETMDEWHDRVGAPFPIPRCSADTVQFTDPQTATDTRLILADEYEAGLRKMEASGYEDWQRQIQNHKLVIEALRFQARSSARQEPVAFITKAALANFKRGSDPESHVLLRSGNDLRVPLYLNEPQTVQVPADQVARTLALSYGRDPDAMTEWTEMCDADNRPVPIWRVYEEQAEALLAAYSVTRPHHSREKEV